MRKGDLISFLEEYDKNNEEKNAHSPNANDISHPEENQAEKPSMPQKVNKQKKETQENPDIENQIRQRTDTKMVTGILEACEDGFGFLRGENYLTSADDVYVSPTQIRRFRLKTGDEVSGIARLQREGERFCALLYVTTVNGDPPGNAISRIPFENLTPIYPDKKFRLEVSQYEYSTRLIDLIAPIGRGQRGMIVSPPKSGKTTLLKKIAKSISKNHPDVKLIVLLIDERPRKLRICKEVLTVGYLLYF